jgi:hypothetical protein
MSENTRGYETNNEFFCSELCLAEGCGSDEAYDEATTVDFRACDMEFCKVCEVDFSDLADEIDAVKADEAEEMREAFRFDMAKERRRGL